MGRDTVLDELRAAVAAGTTPGPAVRRALADATDPMVLRVAGRLLAGREPGATDLPTVRVEVLASCTVEPLDDLLRARLLGADLLPDVVSGGYGTLEPTMAGGAENKGDNNSADVVVCLLHDGYFLPDDWSAADLDELGEHLAGRTDRLRALVASYLRGTGATLVLHTVPLPAQARDGVIGWRDRARLCRLWYGVNSALLDLAQEHRQVVVTDLVGALAEHPYAVRDDRLHRFADLPYTDGALLVLATEVRRVAQARAGASRKVLALDLDGTLWGGVLGEVGPHGVQLGGLYPGNCHRQLQRTVLRLREQGVVLVLASKNDADLVSTTLAEHPEVLLRSDAFAVTAVNWAPKAANLRQAVDSLGLSPGAVVFMDDSPFERGQVSDELPEVAVVAADGDPAGFVRRLLGPGWFDVMELTDTDRRRPQLYRSRAVRADFADGFGSRHDYLAALGLRMVAEPVTDYAVARVAQLAARTNQFNLTGRRFDDAATAAMSADPDHLVAAFSVSDRFGDEGVVGAVWVDRGGPVWRVSNLVLSCRVLSRGVELAMAGWLVDRARAAGAVAVEGRFVPTGRNGVAAGFWESAGFRRTGDGVFVLTTEPTEEPSAVPSWIDVREGTGVA